MTQNLKHSTDINRNEHPIVMDKNFFNPYFFAPISKEVFTPKWRNLISHDIPFSDGISGFIDIRFEALTPIIVKEGKENSSSVNLNGKYFIPGTSIKGMIRNVLEVISLSKMGSVVGDNRYSVRDLTPANIDYTLKSRTDEINAGLLIMMNDKYYLIECPKCEKLKYSEIEEIVEGSLGVYGSQIGRLLKNAGSVKEKYDLLKNIYFYLDNSSDTYVIFCTGKMQNKEHEYGIKIPATIVARSLDIDLMNDFLFIHEKETKSKSWDFWKSKIQNFKNEPTYDELCDDLCYAPVFYSKGADDRIESLGLAFLHREPYKYSIHHFIGDEHKIDDLDMAQCIFGSSEHKLKGRVQFSHALVDMNDKRVNPTPTNIVLGSPKPSFYPFYLKQNGDKVSTFSDPEGEINGWKRYLVHEDIVNQLPNQNQKVNTKIKPLPKGVSFISKIRFYNLKPEELGALLSAITFHNNSDKCFHLIGMAKPLGYGKLKMTDVKLSVSERDAKMINYMAMFEYEICRDTFDGNFGCWSDAILPLFKIASGNFSKKIRYPDGFLAFKTIKKEKLSLIDFSPFLSDFALRSLNKQG